MSFFFFDNKREVSFFLVPLGVFYCFFLLFVLYFSQHMSLHPLDSTLVHLPVHFLLLLEYPHHMQAPILEGSIPLVKLVLFHPTPQDHTMGLFHPTLQDHILARNMW